MEAVEEVTIPVFVPVEWSTAAESMLLPAVDGDANALIRIREKVAAGRMTLLGVFDDDDMVAACVIGTADDVAIIHAAGGSWQGGGLVESLLPVLEVGFLRAGKARVRVETFRRGMMEKITRQGYTPRHVAFEKVL